MNKNKPQSGGSWLVKAIIFLGIVIIILVSLAIFKETNKKKQIQNEINELQKQAEKIKQENSFLADKITYLESRDYQEKEAKNKLNLQNPEEKVVVIEQEIGKNSPEPEQKIETVQQIIIEVSNIQKWLDYFFKY